MDDRWTDRLSEYLDGELAPAERAELERHLAGCPRCAATLAELRAVVSTLAQLSDTPPAHDLWHGIEARLGPVPVEAEEAGVISLAARRRRFSFTLPQLAAAAIAVIALSSGVAWLVASGVFAPSRGGNVAVVAPAVPPATSAPATSPAPAVAAPVTSAPAAAPPAPSPEPVGAATGGHARLVRNTLTRGQQATRDYNRAVNQLEAVLRTEQSHLRPETVQALQKSLADIDRALADARHALARDPANVYLNAHLAETMRLKLEFLRDAASLTQS